MSLCLLIFTDGRRNCLVRTIESAREHVVGEIAHAIIINDSADADYAAFLDRVYPEFERVHHPERRGFGGAIQSGWAHLPEDTTHVFHLEDDFEFNREVDLAWMASALDDFPHLAQLALRRQAWSDAERTAGGVVEMWPDAYTERLHPEMDAAWLEHRLFFTTNPTMYRKSLTEPGWPDGEASELQFTTRLLEDPDLRFGYWGRRDDEPWVTHIGDERTGTGY